MENGYGGVFGTFFVCGLGEDNFISLTPGQLEMYKKKYKKAEVLVGVRGNMPITFKVDAVPKQPQTEKPKTKPAQER